jgi:hypothetical protein
MMSQLHRAEEGEAAALPRDGSAGDDDGLRPLAEEETQALEWRELSLRLCTPRGQKDILRCAVPRAAAALLCV